MTTKDIDSLVADNRRQIRDEFGRFIQVDEGRTRDLKFGVSFIETDVDATVDVRPTGSQVVAGHDDDSKGFGRGTFGDDKGEWEGQGREQSVDYGDAITFGIWNDDNSFGRGTFGDDKSDISVTNTAQQSGLVTRTGRYVIAELISGGTDGVTGIQYGDDTTEVSLSDDGLGNLLSTVGISSRSKPALNKSHVRGILPSTTFLAGDGDETFEVGVESNDGDVMARVVLTANAESTDEVRVGVITEFTGTGVGNSSITYGGEAAFADAIQVPGEGAEFIEWAFGEGTDPDKSSTSLPGEVFRVDASATSDRDRALLLGDADAGEDIPTGDLPFDAASVGIYDDEGRLVWATPISPTTVDDATKFNVEAFFKVS